MIMTTLTKAQKQRMRQWIEHLESGWYKQGKYQLRDSNDNFCCLGVACNVYAINKPNVAKKQQFKLEFMTHDVDLPLDVKNYFGISYTEENILIDLNDKERQSFNQIARYLRNKYNIN